MPPKAAFFKPKASPSAADAFRTFLAPRRGPIIGEFSVTKTDALAVFDESVTPNFKLSTRPAADGVRRLAQDVGEQVSVDRELRRVDATYRLWLMTFAPISISSGRERAQEVAETCASA